MSAYPSNAVTSIIPGMAYVQDSKKVYYNEPQLPPPPKLGGFNYVSGITCQYYNDGALGGELKTYFVFDNPSATTELIYIEKVRSGSNNWMSFGSPWDCSTRKGINAAQAQFILPEPVSIDHNTILMLEFEDEDGSPWMSVNTIFSVNTVHQMYTEGEIVKYDKEYYKIYYEIGDNSNTKYGFFVGYGDGTEGYSGTSFSIDNGSYSILVGNSSDPTGWTWAYNLAIIDFTQFTEPSEFPYMFTARIKERVVDRDGNFLYSGCMLSHNSLIGAENVSGSTYKLTRITSNVTEENEDVSDLNIYFEADKYYGVVILKGGDVRLFSFEEVPEDNFYWDLTNDNGIHIYNGFKAYKVTAATLNGESMPVEGFPELFIPYYRKQDPTKKGIEYQSEPSNFGGGFAGLDKVEEAFDWGDANNRPSPQVPIVFMVPSTTEIPDCDDIEFPVGPIPVSPIDNEFS